MAAALSDPAASLSFALACASLSAAARATWASLTIACAASDARCLNSSVTPVYRTSLPVVC
jgi:hypothetical protein